MTQEEFEKWWTKSLTELKTLYGTEVVFSHAGSHNVFAALKEKIRGVVLEECKTCAEVRSIMLDIEKLKLF